MLKKIFIFGAVVLFILGIFFAFYFSKSAPVQKNIIINFNDTGNVSEYSTNGFSNPEKEMTWTDGKEASIVIPVPEIPKDSMFFMSVNAEPFIAKKIKKQDVDVIINDKKITTWNMKEKGIYDLYVPQDIISDVLNVKFKISNPKSPKELKVSKEDTRKLGIAVKSIKLSSVNAENPEGFSAYKIGKQISFTVDGNSEDFIGKGWSGQEKRFRWTDGNDAYVNMFIRDVKDKNLQLVVSGRGIHSPDDEYQKITMYVNDKEIAEWHVSKTANVYSAAVPESVLGTGALKIRFNIEKPFSPNNADTRKLGIAVSEIKIREMMGTQTKIKIALWLKNKVLKNIETEKYVQEK